MGKKIDRLHNIWMQKHDTRKHAKIRQHKTHNIQNKTSGAHVRMHAAAYKNTQGGRTKHPEPTSEPLGTTPPEDSACAVRRRKVEVVKRDNIELEERGEALARPEDTGEETKACQVTERNNTLHNITFSKLKHVAYG